MQTGKIVIIIISCDDKSLDAVNLPSIERLYEKNHLNKMNGINCKHFLYKM